MCCLFGILDTELRLSGKEKARLLHFLAEAAEQRGLDASGYALNHNGRLSVHKAPVPGRQLKFRIPNDTAIVMGHTRMTTQGNEKHNRNNHPFRGVAGGIPFALAHNGVIWNDGELRKKLKLPGTAIETDSYVAVQLLGRHRALDFSSLKDMAENVEGSFTFTLLDALDQLYIVMGDSPLCLYCFPSLGLHIYASTKEIMLPALKASALPLRQAERIPLKSGDLVRLNRKGEIARSRFDDSMLYQPVCRYSLEGGPAWRSSRDENYLEVLRTAASMMGHRPEWVDELLQEGVCTDEIEESLYCGRLV